MKGFLGALKVLVLMVGVMVVSGCGSTLAITRSEVMDFKNTPDPDIVFVIENKTFIDMPPPGFFSDVNKIVIDPFDGIAKAINIVFKDKRISIYPLQEFKEDVYTQKNSRIVLISPQEFNTYKPIGLSYRCKFSADVAIDGNKHNVEAVASTGIVFTDIRKRHVTYLMDKVFLDFAKKLKEKL